jgi:TrmH family RNA methyltransferase
VSHPQDSLPPTITSLTNERVKYVRALLRRRTRHREGRFVVEGRRLVAEALQAGVQPVLTLYTPAWAEVQANHAQLQALQARSEAIWAVSDAVMAACADTVTPQGLLAVVPMPHLPSPTRQGLLLVLDQVRDPGNVGTILRAAEAADSEGVIVAPGTVDPYNPKVVRAGMGAHFRLPIDRLAWRQIRRRVAGRPVWLADASGEVDYTAVDWRTPAALIIGGEATGASSQARHLSSQRVSIPMQGKAESLNTAMAATVFLFEAARQRTQPPDGD